MGYGPYAIVHTAACVQHFGVLSTSFRNPSLADHIVHPKPAVQLVGDSQPAGPVLNALCPV